MGFNCACGMVTEWCCPLSHYIPSATAPPLNHMATTPVAIIVPLQGQKDTWESGQANLHACFSPIFFTAATLPCRFSPATTSTWSACPSCTRGIGRMLQGRWAQWALIVAGQSSSEKPACFLAPCPPCAQIVPKWNNVGFGEMHRDGADALGSTVMLPHPRSVQGEKYSACTTLSAPLVTGSYELLG